MRTTLTLDDDLAALLKQRAATLGVSFKEMSNRGTARGDFKRDGAARRRGAKDDSAFLRLPCGRRSRQAESTRGRAGGRGCRGISQADEMIRTSTSSCTRAQRATSVVASHETGQTAGRDRCLAREPGIDALTCFGASRLDCDPRVRSDHDPSTGAPSAAAGRRRARPHRGLVAASARAHSAALEPTLQRAESQSGGNRHGRQHDDGCPSGDARNAERLRPLYDGRGLHALSRSALGQPVPLMLICARRARRARCAPSRRPPAAPRGRAAARPARKQAFGSSSTSLRGTARSSSPTASGCCRAYQPVVVDRRRLRAPARRVQSRLGKLEVPDGRNRRPASDIAFATRRTVRK